MPDDERQTHVYDMSFGKVRVVVTMDGMSLDDALQAEQAGLGLLMAMLRRTAAKHGIELEG